MNEILLKNATRNELIKELKKRKSITHIQINEEEGANLMTKAGNVAVNGKAHVFVICENEKESTSE